MTRLDLALAVLIGLGVIVAGVCALDGVSVPDLVEYVVVGCLSAIGARQHHRIARREPAQRREAEPWRSTNP